MVRMLALGKITRLLKKFEDEKDLDKKSKLLLKGFYTANPQELQDEQLPDDILKVDIVKRTELLRKYYKTKYRERVENKIERP